MAAFSKQSFRSKGEIIMYKRVAELIRFGHSPILFTAIEGPLIGKMAVKDGDHEFGTRSLIQEYAESELPAIKNGILMEHIATPPHLVLCGAGHVSVCTAKIAKMIGFRVTIIDDRVEFANRDRFPDADEIINMPFSDALKTVSGTNTYYVIVTRGHINDRLCLETILHQPFSYCGMIGSKTKIKIVFETLRSAGYRDDLLSRVHSPIGLEIGAETPEEIAVCIVGEMIQVKNGSGRCTEWDKQLVNTVETMNEPYAMVTLIEKHGSAPRSTGARMIVKTDGSIISSIGGGFGEFEAAERAKEMLTHGPHVKRYTCKMNNQDAAEKGMICGGSIDILIQIVEG